MELIEAKVDRIFYPIVPKDEKEFKNSSNSFNCPIVSGYPDVIKSSIDPESKFDIPFDNPVISFHDNKILKKSSYNYLASL
jgi:predicted nucleotide-binding protein (sugar kinase/HSP70/actin superfamily)